jgi:phage tail tape-measure protein
MATTNRDPHGKRNEDPITGEPGAHPVGVGVGAATGGAAAGAAVGSVTGPVGTAMGMVAGAVVGGLAGKAVAEEIEPTAEEAYWNEQFSSRPYYTKGMTYDDYRPAYHYGLVARSNYAGQKFDEVETNLQAGWDKAKAKSRLDWEKARLAARDAWEREENSSRGA